MRPPKLGEKVRHRQGWTGVLIERIRHAGEKPIVKVRQDGNGHLRTVKLADLTLILAAVILTGCASSDRREMDRRVLRDALTPEAREHGGEEMIQFLTHLSAPRTSQGL